MENQPDINLLQQIIGSIQAQRNQAFDAFSVCEARLKLTMEKLSTAEAKIKDLETKKEKHEK